MKIFKTGIISAVMCILSAFTALAAQGTISFSDPQVTAGDEVNVSMKVTADEGTSLQSANIVLTYDSGLEFVSGTDADGGAGAVRVHGASNGAGTSELDYNLKFKTSQAGSYSISIDSYEVYDSNDQPVDFTHLGSSAVTVAAAQSTSSDASATGIEVYPGTLDPAFSADVKEYNLSVGLSVNDINVSVVGVDADAKVNIDKQYNGDLPEGQSDIVVTVTAADGVTSNQYTIHVSKAEGGAEANGESALNVEGIKLSSKGKTIIVMNPPADLTVPEGLKEGTITIDGQKVQGWVWGASEEPEYCVVYGMTADSSKSDDDSYGNIGFYRYDMTEKTIQRYFEDPLASGSVSSTEYAELQNQLTEAEKSSETRLIIIVALAVIAFAAVMISVYMSIRVKTNEKVQRSYRRRSLNRYADDEQTDMKLSARMEDSELNEDKTASEQAAASDIDDVKELLKHDYSAESAAEEAEQNAADETQVIRRPERKRRPRRIIRAERIDDENEEISSLDDNQDLPSVSETAAVTQDETKAAEAVSDNIISADTADDSSAAEQRDTEE